MLWRTCWIFRLFCNYCYVVKTFLSCGVWSISLLLTFFNILIIKTSNCKLFSLLILNLSIVLMLLTKFATHCRCMVWRAEKKEKTPDQTAGQFITYGGPPPSQRWWPCRVGALVLFDLKTWARSSKEKEGWRRKRSVINVPGFVSLRGVCVWLSFFVSILGRM